ncbi:hypothetical protein BCR35DRAFT_310950 [Leucosporidium creatinivorum]|uniref:Peptide hydrolase n=1 Tax=Leucosporidium creatinivorum TaxID=106004 RepID=A0A1Y2CJI1_9BASI|nr:hypothetical protein BCR35DRAFT_310950 [Leucosporidium creatinivorum]
MKLVAFASLSSLAVAVVLPQQPQQFTLLAPTSHSHSPSLFSLLPDLESTLSSLPSSHSSQLAQHLAALPEKRLIQLTEDGDILQLTEGEKSLLVYHRVNFIDVTHHRASPTRVQPKSPYPTNFKHSASSLNSTFNHISIPKMQDFLSKFTAFYTRYYRSPSGKESQKFLLGHLNEIHEKTNKKANVSISEFEHSWGQNSIIVRMEPREEKMGEEPVVILSAHQDSTNSLPFLRAPGADDDGSGTTVLLSIFEALLAGKFVPTTNPLEFHFYSAEEGGMLGSGAISRSYADQGRQVRAVYHTDVVAFVKKGTEPRIGVISDNVDQDLTEFMRRVIGEFAEIPYVDTKCGYACSDHSSWQKLSYPSSCLSEGRFEDSNTHMHSAQDTTELEEFSWEHMRQFARVGVAVAGELAGLERE